MFPARGGYVVTSPHEAQEKTKDEAPPSPPLYIPSSFTHLPRMALGFIDSNGRRCLDGTHGHLYPSVMPLPRLR